MRGRQQIAPVRRPEPQADASVREPAGARLELGQRWVVSACATMAEEWPGRERPALERWVPEQWLQEPLASEQQALARWALLASVPVGQLQLEAQ